jgi:translocation and assembly module TamA
MGPNLYRNLLGGVVERLESDTDKVLSQRLRLGRSQETPRRDRFYFAEVERGERITEPDRVSTIAISANYHLVLRRLDSILLPTEGWSLSLQGGLGRSHGSNSSTGFYSRLYGRGTWYRRLGGQWYGQARLELGQVLLPSDVSVPDSQLWRAGGDDSVRGYGYRSLGPLVDGSLGSGPSLMTASVELAHPILDAMPSLWGAVFVDAGRAAASFNAINPALGYGAGVRWRSPVGPLKLDLAWGQEVRKVRLHFSVGIVF